MGKKISVANKANMNGHGLITHPIIPTINVDVNFPKLTEHEKTGKRQLIFF